MAQQEDKQKVLDEKLQAAKAVPPGRDPLTTLADHLSNATGAAAAIVGSDEVTESIQQAVEAAKQMQELLLKKAKEKVAAGPVAEKRAPPATARLTTKLLTDEFEKHGVVVDKDVFDKFCSSLVGHSGQGSDKRGPAGGEQLVPKRVKVGEEDAEMAGTAPGGR